MKIIINLTFVVFIYVAILFQNILANKFNKMGTIAIENKMIALKEEYIYPWEKLENDLIASGRNDLLLVGYGSLLSIDSAKRTIPMDHGIQGLPVIVHGVKRIFNYQFPEEVIKKNYSGEDDIDPTIKYSALNVSLCTSGDSLINGRLFKIPVDDLISLREREYGYDLVAVKCTDWYDRDKKQITAYILAARKPKFGDKIILNNNAVPLPVYLNVCLDGASSVSDSFLEMFLSTTWLGNGTRIDEYIKHTLND